MANTITLTATSAGDGCENFQIFKNVSSSANLVNTVTRAQMLAGVNITSADSQTSTYVIKCLPDGPSQTVTNCATGSIGLVSSSCDNSKTYSGNKVFPAVYIVPLGTDTGIVNARGNMLAQPDKTEIYWSGSKVLDTGYRGATGYQTQLNTALTNDYGVAPETIVGGGNWTGSFQKDTALPTECIVKVYGPLTGTAWSVTVDCPVGGTLTTPTPTPTNAVSNGDCDDFGNLACVSDCSDPGFQTSNSRTITETFVLNPGKKTSVRPMGEIYVGGMGQYSNTYNNANFSFLKNSSGTILASYTQSAAVDYQSQNFAGLAGPTTQYSMNGGNFYDQDDIRLRYELTTPGTYTLEVQQIDCINGNGDNALFPLACTNLTNNTNTLNHAAAYDAVQYVFKSVFNGVGMNQQMAVQNIVKFATGRTSVSQNTYYNIKYQSIEVVDPDDSTNIIGKFTKRNNNARVRYFIDGIQSVAYFANVNMSGSLSNGASQTDNWTYREYS